jgi:uncharacterized peroxidase-related enzyme
MRDYRQATLDPADRAICDFAVKLTESPQAMERGDVERLRECGLDDRAIYDIVQIAAMFAYYNRLADGLGIDPEPEWQA